MNAQSFNFHMMRHLPEQVEKMGPLWDTTTFAMESAHHEFLSAVKGTIKNPKKMVECFLLRQDNFETRQEEKNNGDVLPKEKLGYFTKIDESLLKWYTNLCGSISHRDFLSRYHSPDGRTFISRAYSKMADTTGECIVQTKDFAFVQVEVFLKRDSATLAVVRQFLNCIEVHLSEEENHFGFFYDLNGLGSLYEISADVLSKKCVVMCLNEQKHYRVSVVSEGYDHN